MPKLKDRSPKYCKMNGQAVVYSNGRPRYLGRHGLPESWTAYHRFCAEMRASPVVSPPSEEKHVTVRELTAAFLDYAKANIDPIRYGHCRVVVLDFLDKLYGDSTPVDNFKPSCLALVRQEMLQSGRYCRKTINDHTRRIVSIFAWGVRYDLVQETTWRALKTVKSLPEGTPGTFDRDERQPVPDDVVFRSFFDSYILD